MNLVSASKYPVEKDPRHSLCGCLVADHGHLVHVCVVGQLCQHKSRNFRTRYSLRCVRTSQINPVLALGRFVSEPCRTHDYPLEIALFDRLFLALLVVVDVSPTPMPVMQTKRRTPCLFIALMRLCVLSEKRVVGRALRVPSAESTASWPATAASTSEASSAFPCNTLGRWSSGATADGLRASAVTSWPCSSASRIRICPVAPVAPMMRTFTPLLPLYRALQ